jgi:LysR family transcriptional regulator for metE and metH
MTLEIRHLKLVVAVAEAGSLAKAGEALYLTPSALSHQLKEIEEKLGTALFQRINKKMLLTPIGERVLRAAHAILHELEATETEVRRLVAGDTGTIRISTECYTCYHWLPAILQLYHETFPNIDVSIIAEATRRPTQFLLEEKLDVAIVSAQLDHASLVYTPLFTDEIVVVMSKHHRLSTRAYITAEDLCAENFVMYDIPVEEVEIFQKVLFPAGCFPQRIMKIQLTEAIVEMIKAGFGITTMAKWATLPYLNAGQLVTIPLTEQGLHRTWYAVTLQGKLTLPYIRSFMEHLSSHLPHHFTPA